MGSHNDRSSNWLVRNQRNRNQTCRLHRKLSGTNVVQSLPVATNNNRGTEFFAEVQTMIEANYGIKICRITKRNPQANAIVERAHGTSDNRKYHQKLLHSNQ